MSKPLSRCTTIMGDRSGFQTLLLAVPLCSNLRMWYGDIIGAKLPAKVCHHEVKEAVFKRPFLA
jgi:hypothetical protein